MPAFAQSPAVLPFPIRFPPPARLALARRRRSPAPDDPGETAVSAVISGDDEQLSRQTELELRERTVADTEVCLTERVRDLDELEALLRAREALIVAARLRDSSKRGVVTQREADALHQLKEELDRQESSQREVRQAFSERDQFLEGCETQLFAKVQQQQERETELDQREENLAAREARLGAGPPKHVYDEFRE